MADDHVIFSLPWVISEEGLSNALLPYSSSDDEMTISASGRR